MDYAYWNEQSGNPVHVPIEEMSVKSQIARPAKGELVAHDTDYLITGAAWTGESDVVKVEVSTNGGHSYAEARLLGEPVKHTWRLWEYPWHTPSVTGPATLYSRATDSQGRTQPAERNESHGTYVINHVLPGEVIIQ